jgi:ribonuclease HI
VRQALRSGRRKKSLAVADVAVQSGVEMLCVMDNQQVAEQCSGIWRGPADLRHASAIERARWVRRCLELNVGVSNWSGWPVPFVHLNRSENAAADLVARRARDGIETSLWTHCGDLQNTKLLVTSDGSCAGGRAGAGAAIFLYSAGSAARLGALAGIRLLDGSSSVDAEFEGVILGLLLCTDFLKLHSVGGYPGEGLLHVLRQ